MGNLREDAGTVNAPIGRCPADRKKMAVVAGGRNAVTHWMVLERYPGAAYVECRLETGRTHQIRVQFASRGLPLVGERKYALLEDPCQIALWSAHLGFAHPTTGEPMSFDREPPMDYPWTAV